MSSDNDILQTNNTSGSNNKSDNIHVRRVGTFTMGISLILVGTAIIISFINPNFSVLTAAKFSPVILIFVGIEVIIASILNKDDKIKYDFLSGFVCFILICGSLLAACIPFGGSYFGPDNRLSKQVYDECYNALNNEEISGMNAYVYVNGNLYDKAMTVEDASSNGIINLDINLRGDFDSPKAFAQKSRDILNKLNNTEIIFDNISIESDDYNNTEYGFSLNLDDKFEYNMTADELEKYVES